MPFGTKKLKKNWNGKRVEKIPSEIQKVRRSLRMLNNSQNLIDLKVSLSPLEKQNEIGERIKSIWEKAKQLNAAAKEV